MSTTTPHAATAAMPRRRPYRLPETDITVPVRIRATDEDASPAFDLYAHCCRVLDGRERSIR